MVGYSMGMAAALGGLFVGYCIYFDHKRRSHPDFKKNLIASECPLNIHDVLMV